MADIDIVTYNCRSIKKNVHVIKDLCLKFKIIALQETMLPKQENNSMSSIHPDFEYVANSPVDLEDGILRGRPYGGVAFLFHRDISSRIKIIPTNNVRLICIDMNYCNNDESVRLINCYMPYFNGNNTDEYIHILGEINNLFSEHDNEHVIALGDFNAHIQSEFGRELIEWCRDSEYILADYDALLSDTFTWISDSTGNTRWLDHVICPQALIASLKSFYVLHEQMGSDHKPLGFKLNLDNFYLCPIQKIEHKMRSYEVGDVGAYNSKSENLLKQIHLPINTLTCRKHGCKDSDHQNAIKTFSYDIVQALRLSGSCKIICKKDNCHNIPGWNDLVKPFHEISREKYLQWKNSGCPRIGDIYQQMITSKKNFKNALKTCKLMKNTILKNRIVKDMNDKKPWNTINKVRKNKEKLPVRIDNVYGERNIAEHWRNHYAKLFSGENHPKIDPANYAQNDNMIVTVINIKSAIKRLSLNSSPGLDGITGSHLSQAHPTLFIHLSLLFTSMFYHNFIPDILSNIKIVNLVKDYHKNLADMSNYRPIALASLIS